MRKMPAMRRTALRLLLTPRVVAYMLALSLAVIYHGNVVNERAEKLVWTSLLQSELDHYLRRAAEDPDYRWRDTVDVALYGEPGTAVPARLARLSLGIHDEIRVDGGQRVALVRDIGGRRLVLTLDITEFEQREQPLTVLLAGSALRSEEHTSDLPSL